MFNFKKHIRFKVLVLGAVALLALITPAQAADLKPHLVEIKGDVYDQSIE